MSRPGGFFKPGNTFGKGGRRKEKQFLEALDMEIKAAPDERGLRVIARKLLTLAADGDIQAIKEVANRIDGMPVATVDFNTQVTDARDLPDSDLIDIATTGSFRTLIEAECKEEPDPVH